RIHEAAVMRTWATSGRAPAREEKILLHRAFGLLLAGNRGGYRQYKLPGAILGRQAGVLRESRKPGTQPVAGSTLIVEERTDRTRTDRRQGDGPRGPPSRFGLSQPAATKPERCK